MRLSVRSTLIFSSIAWCICFSQIKAQTGTPDATHYEIRVSNIDFAATSISASTTVKLTTAGGPLQEIRLELINLEVSGVWVDNTPIVDFAQSDSLVSFPLSSPLQIGDTIAVRIDYSGVPYHEAWGGFHFSGEYAFNLGVGFEIIPHNLGKSWFPCIDNFTDRATYDVFCTLPGSKKAVGGGLLTEVIDNGNGTSTWHWSLAQPVPTYLASLAVGNYALVQATYNGMNGDIPVDFYVRPQDTNKVSGTFINLNLILAIFEDCMGPYSWDRVGYTGTSLGAMEHATNIFIPHGTITGTLSNESLMAHELTHMWMGDKVTCASAEEMWINEGWATFFGMYYTLPLYGDEEVYRELIRDKHTGVLQYCHTPTGDGSYFPLNQIPQQYTYGMSAYDKGSTVCQALRFYLGDSLFFDALRAFIDAYAFNHATSYDMRDFYTAHTGIDMSGFFENFVLNAGTPHYSIDSFAVGGKRSDLYEVSVFAKQKRKGPAFTGNSNVMEVRFMDENWNSQTDTIHFDGPAGRSTKWVSFIPSVVLVDPLEKMCDATTDQVKLVKNPGNYLYEGTFFTLGVEAPADSALVQVTHNWAPPDSLKEAVPGLRLSDYRYWRIEGIMPAGFQATGKFFYSVTSYLDNTLITSSSDTLVMLYRAHTRDDWQEIDFEKIGPWNIGNILVSDLKAGEYVLAVKESAVGGSEEVPVKKNTIEVFPNPSPASFSICLNSNFESNLQIFNQGGILIRTFTVDQGENRIIWDPEGLPGGNYFLKWVTGDIHQPELRKIIYLK